MTYSSFVSVFAHQPHNNPFEEVELVHLVLVSKIGFNPGSLHQFLGKSSFQLLHGLLRQPAADKEANPFRFQLVEVGGAEFRYSLINLSDIDRCPNQNCIIVVQG